MRNARKVVEGRRGWARCGLTVAVLLGAGCAEEASPTAAAAPSAGQDALVAVDIAAAGDAAAPDDTAPAADAAVAPDVAAAGPDASADAALEVPTTASISAGGWVMQPKEETTKCVLKRLDNAEEIYVTRIRTQLSSGSHHMIIYKSDAATEQLEAVKCTPFTETLAGGNVPLMITQVADDKLQLPAGVAFKLGVHQMIRIEMHFINYTKGAITATGDVHFDTMPKAEVHDEADLLFYGNPDFNIPKGQSYSTPWKFLSVLPGSKVFALTGHTHSLGKSVDIAFSKDGSTPAAPSLLYPADVPYSWSEPPLEVFDPPLEFKQGEGFQYRCTWLNGTGSAVGFGESANKEMCFFWAYYYPSQGYHMCINTGKYQQYTGSESTCCPEDALCDMIKSYLGK